MARKQFSSGIPLIFIAVWAAAGALASEHSSPSSVGPTSSAEAEILWKEGKTFADKKDYRKAIPTLQRFIDRYPGAKGYLEAHLLLGTAYLETHQVKRALAPLQYFIAGAGTSNDSLWARLTLADAYLDIGEIQEGYLTSREVEKAASATPALLAASQVMKAQAALKLHRLSEATLSLSSAEKGISAGSSVEWRGKLAAALLHLKTLTCAELPSSKTLAEEQTLNEMDRRGVCVLEALNLFHSVLEADYPRASQRSQKLASESFSSYRAACDHPPKPPGKRTARELQSYLSELKLKLDTECGKKIDQAQSTLRSWLPNPEVETLLKSLEETHDRS